MGKPKPANWWSTLPGTLTAIGGIIGALTALIAVLIKVGVVHSAPAVDTSTTSASSTTTSAGSSSTSGSTDTAQHPRRGRPADGGGAPSERDRLAGRLTGKWQGQVNYRETPATLRVQIEFSPCETANACVVNVHNLEGDNFASGLLPVDVGENGLISFDQPSGPARRDANDPCPRAFLKHGGSFRLSLAGDTLLRGAVDITHPDEGLPRPCGDLTLLKQQR